MKEEGPDGADAAPAAVPPTERRSDRTRDIDELPTLALLERLNDEDATVAAAVRRALPQLSLVVDAATRSLRQSGQVHYFGSGTSGRLALLDAAELGPTFGLTAGTVVAHLAGGVPAMTRAVEDAEDSFTDGRAAAGGLTPADTAIGLSASGSAQYVAGALAAGREAGAFTALFTANAHAQAGSAADVIVCADTGPEAIAGSTRLKAGTACKLLLNGFSTALMVRDGRTYSNLMVAVEPLNAKLRARQVRLLTQSCGASAAAATAMLAAAGGEVQVALVALLAGITVPAARRFLQDAGGVIRLAVERAAGPG